MKTVALVCGFCIAGTAAAADLKASDPPVDLPKLTVTPIESWAAYLDHMSLYVIAEIGITAELPPLNPDVALGCVDPAVFADAMWLEGSADT